MLLSSLYFPKDIGIGNTKDIVKKAENPLLSRCTQIEDNLVEIESH